MRTCNVVVTLVNQNICLHNDVQAPVTAKSGELQVIDEDGEPVASYAPGMWISWQLGRNDVE